ncbi:hypothetical protein G9A89_016026 [Geosiphon pyriformis]|nr:hypothetical protein G9A89_016026 [Geosiphon pyriformis]
MLGEMFWKIPSKPLKPGLQVNNKVDQLKKRINQSWRAEINELKQQINEMAKLLSAVTAKLGITVEKEKDIIATQQQSHISEEKRKVENRLISQSTTPKSNLAKKKKTYNPEREIKEIKKTLEPIMELLKQMKKQGSWSSPTAGESKSMETDDV